MSVARTAVDRVYEVLRTVKDPEIPVIDIVELGIVRDVTIGERGPVVTVTPTYTGCPIMAVIERLILDALEAGGMGGGSIDVVYAPAWTTDWLTEEAKERLREYGIAPPGKNVELPMFGPNRTLENVACPFCGSDRTRLEAEFGSTACKALYKCGDCLEPFDHFKCI